MMTGNGADIECYADRENQPVQMAVRFWIARNSQLQAIQRAELFRQSAFLLFEIAFNAVTNILGDFQRVTQCIQVTAFHKMVNINSRATQEIDFQVARRCGSSGCSIACSMSTRPCSSTPASRNCWSIAARSLASI